MLSVRSDRLLAACQFASRFMHVFRTLLMSVQMQGGDGWEDALTDGDYSLDEDTDGMGGSDSDGSGVHKCVAALMLTCFLALLFVFLPFT